MAIPVELSNRDTLVKSASTALNSKVVSRYSKVLSPLAVDAALSVVDLVHPDLLDLRDILVLKKLSGIVDDTELVRGLIFDKKASQTPTVPQQHGRRRGTGRRSPTSTASRTSVRRRGVT
jgi:T-complex protein 1 subunit delta